MRFKEITMKLLDVGDATAAKNLDNLEHRHLSDTIVSIHHVLEK
jgi:hypothetical protein